LIWHFFINLMIKYDALWEHCNKHQQPFSRLLVFCLFLLYMNNYLHLHLASNKQTELKWQEVISYVLTQLWRIFDDSGRISVFNVFLEFEFLYPPFFLHLKKYFDLIKLNLSVSINIGWFTCKKKWQQPK
jgi:hypothetical protein